VSKRGNSGKSITGACAKASEFRRFFPNYAKLRTKTRDGLLGDDRIGRLIYAPLSLNNVSYTLVEPAVVGTFTYH